MKAQKAKENYLGKSASGKKMNCCESVAYVFQDEIPLTAEELQSFAGFGGGRAPGGYCGAIYAAKYLLEKKGSPKAAEIDRIFVELAGSPKCRDIKALRKVSCLVCIEKAAEIVDKA